MARFADGLDAAQRRFGCHLVGGDTDRTPGPLSVGVTAVGALPSGTFVGRQGAKAGDHIMVTGTIGDAALGLAIRNGGLRETLTDEHLRDMLLARYLRPEPRLALANALRTYASAALDISDGLMKDMARLAGPLGLEVQFDAVPLSPPARAALARDPSIATAILGGGDYEVLAAVPPANVAPFMEAAERCRVLLSDLGVLESGRRLEIVGPGGVALPGNISGYDHFAR
jgi:thiamine-monophosphate kinase